MIQSPRAPQIADQRAAACARSRSHPRGPTAGPGAEAAKGPHSSLACRRRDAAGLRRRLQGSQSESPTAAIPGRSYRAGTGRLPERFRRQLSRSGPAPMATRRLHVCSRKVPCPAARPPNIKSTFGQGLKHCDFTPFSVAVTRAGPTGSDPLEEFGPNTFQSHDGTLTLFMCDCCYRRSRG